MVTKDKKNFVENVDGVDGPPTCEDVSINSLNMESVLRTYQLIGKLNIVTYSIQVQITFWKPHHYVLIYWGFFVVNDDLPINLENPQCYDVLFVDWKKHQIMFFPKVIF